MRWLCALLVLVACEDSRKSRPHEQRDDANPAADQLEQYDQQQSVLKRKMKAAAAAVAARAITTRCTQPAPECLPASGLIDPDGDDVAPTLEGKVVVLDFWASWCRPCEAEARVLDAVQGNFSSQPVVVLGMNTEGFDGDALVDGAAELQIHYGLVELAAAMGAPTNLPSSYIYDKHGNRRDTHVGAWTQPELAATIDRLLAEP